MSDGGSISSNFGVTSTVETINAPLIIGDTSGTTYNFYENIVPSDVINFNGSVTGAAGTGNTTTLDFNQIVSTSVELSATEPTVKARHYHRHNGVT